MSHIRAAVLLSANYNENYTVYQASKVLVIASLLVILPCGRYYR